jgi:hypothetical protein
MDADMESKSLIPPPFLEQNLKTRRDGGDGSTTIVLTQKKLR